MSEDDEQLRVRVAWLYFMEAHQADIAGKLGITRLRANRLLGEARESGLVNIQVNARLAGCVELERQLVHETGLKDAVVVPTPTDQDQIAPVLGRATADYLARHLGETRVRGWASAGAPLRGPSAICAGNFPSSASIPRPDPRLELNTFEIAMEFARRINGQCSYLAAPICRRPALARHHPGPRRFPETQAAGTNDVALLSVGDLSRRSL
jgi:DNA-binding transcriptional regulator LsrR (DeoR family)